jgi:hypothetical protein
MFDTIWKARVHLLTAEMKIWFAGVTHGPTANAVVKVE